MRASNLSFQAFLMAIFLVSACIAAADEQKAPDEGSIGRIGVYDSRAIVSAYIGSKYFNAYMGDLRRQHNIAKAEGDAERVAELEAEGAEHQHQIHRMGFSTAPVDDLLKHIQDKLPAIATDQGVGPIISKWDKEALAKYKTADQIDVTMALVRAFEPSAKQLKGAEEIQKHDPVPLEQFDQSGEKAKPKS